MKTELSMNWRNENRTILFRDIEDESYFKFDGEVCFKLNSLENCPDKNDINAVCLGNGRLFQMHDDAEVNPILEMKLDYNTYQ